MMPKERDELEEEIKSYTGKFLTKDLQKGSKVFVANIGSQSGETWSDFVAPTEATITEVRIDFNNINNFNPKYGFGGGEYTFKTDKNIQFSLPIIKDLVNPTDEYITSRVEYNGYNFLDADLDRLKMRVEKELIRILTGRWAGQNKVLQSEALKMALKQDHTEFFSSLYPELLI